jgi:hypothetical protein
LPLRGSAGRKAYDLGILLPNKDARVVDVPANIVDCDA